MQTKKMWVGIIAIIIFVIGVGYFISSVRPVTTMQAIPINTTTPPSEETPTGTTNSSTRP